MDRRRVRRACAYEAFALHDTLRLGADGGDLRRVADRLACWSARPTVSCFPLAAHAGALRDRDPEGVDRGLLPRAADRLVILSRTVENHLHRSTPSSAPRHGLVL